MAKQGRSLNGAELAGFIKERQLHQVRNLRQSDHVFPKLAILQTHSDPVIDTYVRLKKAYGNDIGVEVTSEIVDQAGMIARIEILNSDDTVQGIIVQLPLEDSAGTEPIVEAVAASKDVDALSKSSAFTGATATAIDWLLGGYNTDLRGKTIVIVGNGRLVGAPLYKLWNDAGLNVTVVDIATPDIASVIIEADIVVSAAGSPGLVTSSMLKQGAIVVDAGTTSEGGVLRGDVDADVRERNDISITPERGGVGPLTISALFDNLIRAARATVPSDS